MNTQEATSLRKQLIENNHAVKIVASGYSMFPFMRNGDVQIISTVPIEEIKVGDVAVFERDNDWISHRVINIRKTNNETILMLRGDTCIQVDPLVTKENFIGKTVSFERDGKVYEVGSKRNKRIARIILSLGLVYNSIFYYCGRMLSCNEQQQPKVRGRS
jgi:signal peptidase I